MLSLNNRNLILFILLIALISILSIVVIACDQPNIHDATYEELQEINGIGEVLSLRIVSYLKLNKTATIDDLSDIYGIGVKRLELIKEVYD